jgi:hypothetical protein
MAEKLYTIPVNEAFDEDCECPLCLMRKKIEEEALRFTLGPSYMEADIREVTDRLGFCTNHISKIAEMDNKIGIAWILKTHLDKVNADVKKMAVSDKPAGFMKKADNTKLIEYLKKLETSCFVCEKVEPTFERYIATVYHLYKNDDNFVTKYRNSKGFCMKHYAMLIEGATKAFSGNKLSDFLADTHKVYIDNMNRVRDDVAWFINKFDYKYKDEPWKNSKDALPRAMNKLNSYMK